jgi:adenosylhomocysteine nucleosidase
MHPSFRLSGTRLTRLLGALALAASVRAETRFDVLVQGAMDSELQPLLAALTHKREVNLGAWTFWTGHIAGKSVVVSRTEQGPVNAVAATVLGIRHFRPRAVINQGTAGAHSRKLKLFDIVVGEWTTDYSALFTDHADAGKGTRLDRWHPKVHQLRLDNKNITDFPRFGGDKALVDLAMAEPNPRGKVWRGNIGSAFQFHREIDTIAWFHKTFGTDSEDMESAYSAGAAMGLQTPFLAVRIISDVEWEHPQFEKIAGEYCAEFVANMVKKMPKPR